ncbi:hypothetical protein [Desertivirga arenae]|nr:hypothetical protein [Pedobacter sp. SYSU D00823]
MNKRRDFKGTFLLFRTGRIPAENSATNGVRSLIDRILQTVRVF